MTADHWNFVLAAYAVAAIALTTYWRHLCRRERELTETKPKPMNASRHDQRSQPAPAAGHPRSTPASRPPLP